MLYYNECREKQGAAKQTFVFHKPLTNEPSVEQTAERVSAGFMSGYLANVNTPGKENFNPRGVFMFALPRHLPAIGGKIIPSIYPRISGDINAYYLFLFSAASLNSFKAAANFIEDADGFPRKILLR